MGDTITVSGTVGGDDYEINISGLTYVHGVLDKEDASDTLKNLVCALCDYYVTARAFIAGVDLESYLTTEYM